MKSSSISPAEKEVKKNLDTFLLFKIFLWVLIFFVVISSNVLAIFEQIGQDEGVFLVIASGLKNYLLPYADFFDHKPPGIYFFLSFFTHFIKSPFGFRIIFLIINCITSIFVLKSGNLIKKNTGYIGMILYLGAIPLFQGNRILAEPILALLVSISMYLVLANKSNYTNSIYRGVIFFLFVFIKQTGFLSGIALLYAFINRSNRKGKIIFFLVVFFCAVLLTFWFVLNKNFDQFIKQAIFYNFTNYPKEPILFVIKLVINLIIHTFPLWLFAIAGIIISKKLIAQKIRFFLLLMLFLPIPFFFVRHYEHYWIQILPALCLFAAIFINFTYYYMSKWATLLIAIILFFNIWGNFKLYFWRFQNQYWPQYQEYIKIDHYLEDNRSKYILAENQFIIFYFNSDKKRLNKYLYITEINNTTEQSEEKTIEDLNSNLDTIVLWPINLDYAYAKELQKYILSNFSVEKTFKQSGLVIYKRPI